MMRGAWLVLLLTAAALPARGMAAAPEDPFKRLQALMFSGRYADALQQTDVIEQSTDDLTVLARLELTRGTIWQVRGFARVAADHFQRALDIAMRAESRALVVVSYGALAGASSDLGQWDRVLDFADKRHEAEQPPSDEADYRYFFQRGVASIALHSAADGERDLQQALGIAQNLGDARSVSMAFGQLASVAADSGLDARRSLDLYDQAIEVAADAELPDLEATFLADSGAVLLETGDFAGARSRLDRAIAIEDRTRARRVTTAARKNLARILIHDGDARAAALLAAAQLEADDQDLTPLRWELRIERASLLGPDDPALASRLFAEALDLLDEGQGSVLVEQLRTGTLTGARIDADPYGRYIDFLLEQGRDDDAFFVAERGRARAFLDTLRAGGNAIEPALPPSYVEDEAAVLADVWEGQAALRAGRPGSGEREALEQTLRDDQRSLDALRMELRTERPAIAALRFPELWHAADLRARALKPGTALLEYFLGATRSTAWLVDANGMRTIKLPPRAEIEAAARAYLDAARAPGNTQEPTRAAQLYQMLMPAGGDPLPADLVIVPHGILCDLPFEALRDADGRRLVERSTMAYAASAFSFASLSSRAVPRRESPRALLVGSPSLPELQQVARLFGPAATSISGDAATEAALRRPDTAAASILHLAGGQLRMREVYGLQLTDALVTLSASETAFDRNARGEGMTGVARAFFSAGADAVVARLWSADDRSTADFMREFYGALASGADAAAALRQAKLRLLHDDRYAAPAYWAPFILIGQPGWRGAPPAVSMPPYSLFVLAAALVIMMAAGAWIYRRRRGRAAAPAA